jgi:hypothetical protein
MGTDIGYLQTKISQNKQKIEELEKMVDSLNLLINNKSKIIDEDVKKLRKISDEIENINLINLKEQVTSSVISNLRKVLEKSHEKNLHENKQKMLSWWKEIKNEREKQRIEVRDETNSHLNSIIKILFKILESNNLKVDKIHLETMAALTLTNKETEKWMKKVNKLQRNQVQEEGMKRLKQVFPTKDFAGAKKSLNKERDNAIKKIKELEIK